MDQLLRLVKRLNEANLCTERDEFGEFCAKKRPCPIHEPEQMFGERPLTTGDAPQVPQPIPVGGKDEEE